MKNEQLTGLLLAASIHEIKNRFGVLYTHLDTVLPTLPTEQTHTAERIKAEAEVIGHELMRVLTSYKHLQDESGVLIDQQFVAEFLEDCLARHGYTQAANQVLIEMACDEDLTGFFDAKIVTIVLDTLIYNAIKAGAQHLQLSASEQDGWLFLDVDDDGPGFPSEFPEHITAPSDLALETGSTGLGLYLAQRMLGAHQEGEQTGHLELGASSLLKGARVRIALPQ